MRRVSRVSRVGGVSRVNRVKRVVRVNKMARGHRRVVSPTRGGGMAMHAQGEQGEHNRVCVVSSQCRDSASQNGERAHLKRRHGNA